MKKTFYPGGVTLVLWTASVFLFVMGVLAIVYAKQSSDISLSVLGSVAWGASVFLALAGFLHLNNATPK